MSKNEILKHRTSTTSIANAANCYNMECASWNNVINQLLCRNNMKTRTLAVFVVAMFMCIMLILVMNNLILLRIMKIKTVSQKLSQETYGYESKEDMLTKYNISESTYRIYQPLNPATRLGNHMFQYASLYGIARETGRQPVIPPTSRIPELFPNITAIVTSPTKWDSCVHVSEKSFAKFDGNICDEITATNSNVCLVGYLQSWKYFHKYENGLRQEFQINNQYIDIANAFLWSIKNNISDKYKEKDNKLYYNSYRNSFNKADIHTITWVGVQVRRGDMISPRAIEMGYRLPDLAYIEKAMTYFRQKYQYVQFIVCSDSIEWSKILLGHHQDVTFSGHTMGQTDLAILSVCNHSITTVGTYGWWAGWLAGGEVLYYDNPIEGNLAKEFNPSDYFPPHWKGMGND